MYVRSTELRLMQYLENDYSLKKNVFVRAVVILYCRSQVKRLAELSAVNYKCICQGIPLSATMLCKWLP